METRRWTNPSQPQTLYMATFLLYIEAFFNILSSFQGQPLFLLVAVGQAAGGMGIANEKRWGYYLAVATSAIALYPLLRIVTHGLGDLLSLGVILEFLFPAVLVALLVHPMSRQYQKIWFH
jgi:hypothetical protein